MKRRIAIYMVGIIVATGSLAWSLTNNESPHVPAQMETAVPHVSPSTMPATTRPVLPEEYSILQTRSAFGHSRGAGGSAGGPGGGPEAGFIFKGVVQADNTFTAFIQGPASKNVLQVGVGATVARGRIKSIDLDSMEYEMGADVKRIMVGQNLEGATPPPPPPPATKPSRQTGPEGGQPKKMKGGPDGMPQQMTPEMIEAMRQQAQQRDN